jgi:leucyl/phenylalanyl-tRNA--protein transferase
MNKAFGSVIQNCAGLRENGEGTWITGEMMESYIRLHHAGFAHSVESWSDGELAGGLYGVSLGSAFFGESMFAKKTDASKVAFVFLIRHLIHSGCTIIDCQITTKHLVSLGAREIPRSEFLKKLKAALRDTSNII